MKMKDDDDDDESRKWSDVITEQYDGRLRKWRELVKEFG